MSERLLRKLDKKKKLSERVFESFKITIKEPAELKKPLKKVYCVNCRHLKNRRDCKNKNNITETIHDSWDMCKAETRYNSIPNLINEHNDCIWYGWNYIPFTIGAAIGGGLMVYIWFLWLISGVIHRA